MGVKGEGNERKREDGKKVGGREGNINEDGERTKCRGRGRNFVGLCVCLSLIISDLNVCVLPGRDLEPGLGVRPRALITSTSS